jgi:pantothenate kinase
MDGYHLSHAQLAAMPDPATAIHRRCAAFTFDAEAFYRLVQSLQEPVAACSGNLYAPSFDHAIKDPVADDISILPRSRVVILRDCILA